MTQKLLEGPNLKLVPYSEEYAELMQSWFYDHRYAAYFRDFEEVPLSLADFKNLGRQFEKVGQNLYIIILKEANQPIGLMTNCCLKKKSGVFRFGILLDADHQRKTYAIEAIVIHGHYLYEYRGCQKLCVEILKRDEHIQRITEQGGFIFETVLKAEAKMGDEYLDEVRFYMDRARAYELYSGLFEELKKMPCNQL